MTNAPLHLGDSTVGNGSYTVAVPGGLVVEAAAVLGILVAKVAAVPGGVIDIVKDSILGSCLLQLVPHWAEELSKLLTPVVDSR
ncbi:hypothetical protein Tco_0050707 [Tanacetum coccineum]